MTIAEIKKDFQNQLSEIYSSSESALVFSIFLEKLSGINNFQQKLNQDQEVDVNVKNQLETYFKELLVGKPYQQILGEAEFFGETFFVNEHVLIPRPETEELLELAIKKIKAINNESSLKILDIGTGSGIIPIIIKKHFPDANVSAIDISTEALKVARKNAELHQVEINFIQKDYLNQNLDNVYDVIISNPPYIAIEENPEIEHSVKGFEPNIALFSPTSDALIFYRKIAADAENYLKAEGFIFLEINQKLGRETLQLYKTEIFESSHLIKDISGNDRIIVAQKK